MLEQLFGSKTRLKLLVVFLNNPEKAYYVRELVRKLNVQINSVRRELKKLEILGIVKVVPEQDLTQDQLEGSFYGTRKESQALPLDPKEVRLQKKGLEPKKKFYILDHEFLLGGELKALFLKDQFLSERDLIKSIQKIGGIRFLALCGIFVGRVDSPTDILIVGKVNHRKLGRLIRKFEQELNHEVNYTILSKEEYKYRKDITDRFLYDILEGRKIVMIDKLK